MIIAVINEHEVRRLGEFSCVEDAVEVYGEQSELVAFETEEAYDTYVGVMNAVSQFTQAMLLLANEPDQ